MLKLIVGIPVAAILIALFLMRVWPFDNSGYVVDTFSQQPLETPNFYISSDSEGAFDVSAAALGVSVAKIANQMPRTSLVSKSDDNLSQTYVSRTALVGYPDYISISIRPVTPETAEVKIFSRSRFGYSDLGVNKGRVQEWLAALRGDLGA